MNSLTLGRALLTVGIAIGLISWWTTMVHIGNPNYVLVDTSPAVSTHPWHHNFREILGDLAAMVVFCLVFFGPARFRTPETWLVLLILMIGYYSGFWIGTPFLPELASDTWRGEAIHLGMSGFSVLGLFVARRAFHAA